tara:strand:+ start:16289 stop:17752 length:1464 start_codon:yes stop_codon:yes gene_type:complete
MIKYKLKKNYISKVIILLLIQIVVLQTTKAEIKLPAIVSSNMVLQRNTTIELWGWAKAKEKIKIKTSWLEKPKIIETDSNGNWSVEIKTTNSKEIQEIYLKSKESNIILKNILFGEVWLCSGQSNMQQPLKGFYGQPTFGSLQTIINSNNPKLRLFTVNIKGSKFPLKDLDKYNSWQEATPNSVPNFSAVAYFFGLQLQKILDVPVGLIHSSWGGSKIEAWMSKEVLSNYQKIDLDKINASKNANIKPNLLYNAMIHPIIRYKIKGALWYQGESNRSEPNKYEKLFPAMVKDWRARFNLGDFPFYYTQIAPFSYDRNKPIEKRINSAFIREAQLKCLDLIPNSGIAITLDIGDKFSIHPPKKKQVANRLLYNALSKTYGFKNIEYVSPIYKALKIENKAIKLFFKNIKTGLYTYNNLKGFEISGVDKIFHPATAKIVNRNQVLVKSDKVKKPIAVRYAWKNWVQASLFGANLLPVSSFRTDNWDSID